MRLPSPRVIAIDDDPKHLKGLTKGLNRSGVACLPIHFTGEMDAAPSCRHARVIFADLNLGGTFSGNNHKQNFSIIGDLIESTIQPSGIYVIVLWTMYPDEADKLYEFLTNRLQSEPKPLTVQALDKKDHLDGQGGVKDPETLVNAITQIFEGQPQLGVLLNWEERVLDAVGDTSSSIVKMTQETTEGSCLGTEVGRLLRTMAAAAVGSEHVDKDRFRALNDALLPILADRIASMHSKLAGEDDEKLWRIAFAGDDSNQKMSLVEASKLNRLLHIDLLESNDNWGGRGTVTDLPSDFIRDSFATTFGISPAEAMESQFRCKKSTDDKSIRWILVQTQAACDHAQNHPGSLPFHVGVCLSEERIDQKRKGPAALWCSPCFEYEEQVCFLHVSARFQMPVTREAVAKMPYLFRLREQLLNDLIYHLHGYGARPGIISFRKG